VLVHYAFFAHHCASVAHVGLANHGT